MNSISLARTLTAGVATLVLNVAFFSAAGEETKHWWKGNLHTHTLWSDGDDYPEMVVAWYKEHGYNFLAISDHNVMLEGERWINAETNRGGRVALEKYVARFGTNWVLQRALGSQKEVRLK